MAKYISSQTWINGLCIENSITLYNWVSPSVFHQTPFTQVTGKSL